MLFCKNHYHLYAFQVPAKYTPKFKNWILEKSFSPPATEFTVKQSGIRLVIAHCAETVAEIKFHVAAFVVVVVVFAQKLEPYDFFSVIDV